MSDRSFIGRPRARQQFGEVSIFRDYQHRYLQAHGPLVKGDVIEIGGELAYGHARHFPNATSFTVSNIAREFELELDATDMPFPDGSQDAFVCVSVLPHMADPALAVAEVHRTLKPGGDFLVVVPFLFPVCDVVDFRRWTPAGLEALLSAFEIRSTVNLGGRISSVANLLQRPVGSRSRRALVSKGFGAVFTSVMGRFDQIDDSPIGVGIHAVKR
jgi:SAM-dependent methyltransferase